jgi:hypothetical protein
MPRRRRPPPGGPTDLPWINADRAILVDPVSDLAIPPLREILVDQIDLPVDAALAQRILHECNFPKVQLRRQDDPSVVADRADMAAGRWRGGRQLWFVGCRTVGWSWSMATVG